MPTTSAPQTITIFGAGWLGLPLGQALAAAGHRVRATTTTPDKLPALAAAGLEPGLLRLEGETPAPEISAALADSAVLVVSFPPGLRSAAGPAPYLARLAAIAGALPGSQVRHVLLLSSTGVYPDQPHLPTVTEVAADPNNPLVQGEELLRRVPGVTTTVVRLAGLMGPGRHPGRFFGPGRTVPQPEAPVNMLHLTDAVGGLAALIAQGVWGPTLNLCAAKHPSRRVFYTAAAEALGPPLPTFLATDEVLGKYVSSTVFRQQVAYSLRFDDPVTALPFC